MSKEKNGSFVVPANTSYCDGIAAQNFLSVSGLDSSAGLTVLWRRPEGP